ncbi:MAG: helix-turn-helix transcriptional regulator [Terriglobia bacterium]|nr:helix-turn-helix transcriptional regulator [Terriglobia bacterium]
MDARALVAKNVRRLRVAKNLSQEALAVDAEIDRTYVSRVERGLENPTVAVLQRIAIALSVDIREFFDPNAVGRAAIRPLPSGRRKRA